MTKVSLHLNYQHLSEEMTACIGCSECMAVCPALAEDISIETINRETLNGDISKPVARFASDCFSCGACVPVCPVGLHRDLMMLWLKMRVNSQGRRE